MSLRSELYGLIDRAQKLCANTASASELLSNLKDLRERLDKPLRVAVVGMVSAGKSTFMNALMGANIAYTGTAETTYTVSWFRYSPTPSVTVRFRDGKEKNVPYEDLEKWSVRTKLEDNVKINDVEYLIVNYPAEVLKKIEFIDTPGLNSTFLTDSQNTMDFLSLQSSNDTLREAGIADAVVFVMSGPVDGMTRDTLMKFCGSKISNTSPINSVGIMTKQDNRWKHFGESHGLLEKIDLHKKQMEKPEVKGILFTILPVFAKAVEGCLYLDSQEWEALNSFSEKDRELLLELLDDEAAFCVEVDEDYMEFGEPEIRQRLIEKLASYGILELTDQLREGKSAEEIMASLQDTCGINAVRDMLLSHFGNRTFLIKAQYIFARLYGMIRQTADPRLREISEYFRDEIDRITSSVHTMKELKVLQMYYNGDLQDMKDEEIADLLRITGEYGRSPEARLNVDNTLTVAELAELAHSKAQQWSSASVNSWWVSGSYVEATRIISRSYSLLHHHLSAILEE